MSSVTAADPGDPTRPGTPPGSLRFFSTLFAPAPRRPLLEALYAFESGIRDSLVSLSHEVAHTRMQWWRAEIDRFAAGCPLHPVTVGLLGLHDCAAGDATLLHEVLTAADLDLARLTYRSWQELEAYSFRAAGALQTLIAAALAGRRELSPAEREFARSLGSAVRQTEMLRDLPRDITRGRLYVPLDVVTAAGLDPSNLQTSQPAALAAVLTTWRDRVDGTLAALPSLLSSAERSTQRPGLVLGALHRRLLERIDVSQDGATTRPEVPPWSRLWTAWSTAVRYA
jgi:phytoene synthase